MSNEQNPLHPARILVFGFIIIILIGSLVLSLPQSSVSSNISYIDSLFTATSAVCVTGLVVLDTGTMFTRLGQTIVMFLILIGSLGFMTMATIIFLFLGHRVSIRDRLIIKEALNQESISGIVQLVKAVAIIAAIFILIGTILLCIRFIPTLGIFQGFFFALFHSISAFGNAGFDLLGNYQSLTLAPNDYLVNGTIMVLFIIGGLGFTVILELIAYFRYRERFSLHAQLVLVISGLLLFGGTILLYILEYNNPSTLGSLAGGAKLFSALFTSSTARTAGFSVVDANSFHHSTILVIISLMFIGASPASTGGGVKTTTIGVLFITIANIIKGRKTPIIFFRQFPIDKILKAIAIIITAGAFVFIATVLLTLIEEHDFIAMFFEVVSAFGTVGLSTGITPDFSVAGKLILIVTMFCGRVGPLTLLVAITRQESKEDGLKYPEEDLIIG